MENVQESNTSLLLPRPATCVLFHLAKLLELNPEVVLAPQILLLLCVWSLDSPLIGGSCRSWSPERGEQIHIFFLFKTQIVSDFSLTH